MAEIMPVSPAPPDRPPVSVMVTNLVVIVLPFVGLIAAMVLLWGRGFDWTSLGLFLGMYTATALGITVGYHRLFTHRSFETHAVIKAILGVVGSMAVQGPLLKWVALHRRHHQHSDQEGDPHSPHTHEHGVLGVFRGLWHAHLGWLFRPDPQGLMQYVGDLERSKLIRVVSALFPLWLAAGLLLPAVLGGLMTWSWSGVLLGFLWGGLVRVFAVHHVTWSVNSVCHLWGTRPFQTNDHSRNNPIFGVLAMGEGWHNNHHAFPTSARHGLRWWQVDTSYLLIRGMAMLGLVWNVRKPARQHVTAKRLKSDEPDVGAAAGDTPGLGTMAVPTRATSQLV